MKLVSIIVLTAVVAHVSASPRHWYKRDGLEPVLANSVAKETDVEISDGEMTTAAVIPETNPIKKTKKTPIHTYPPYPYRPRKWGPPPHHKAPPPPPPPRGPFGGPVNTPVHFGG